MFIQHASSPGHVLMFAFVWDCRVGGVGVCGVLGLSEKRKEKTDARIDTQIC